MIIETKDLVKEYSGRRVVNRVSITVEQGSVVGLLGPNGAGKTTTFYMIVGIERPDEGVVTLDGDDISSLAMYERARAEEERVNKMNSLIEEFRIEHIRKSKGTELSGGERRRVEIARALATDPAFILLDEPFAGIDPIAVSDIQGMIAHLAKRGIGILITDHNVRETLSIVDKAYILANGEILIHGDSETIANDPTARKYYLGENFSM